MATPRPSVNAFGIAEITILPNCAIQVIPILGLPPHMSTAPRFDIDPAAFWRDPYPVLARLRAEAPIAFVPQLGSTLFTRRDDIFVSEKIIDVFSSHQPNGLMNKLMGHNMMRKDGDAHMAERKAIFPSVSPKTVKAHWSAQFQAHADRLLDELAPAGRADLVKAFALPLSAECLKAITGLTNMRYQDMDAWSQAMIDGIANYAGDPAVEARCHAATAGIDAAIDDMAPVLAKAPNPSLLSVMLEGGMPMESVRANIKLAISGGQNEPRDAIAGCIWALLTHPEQLALVRAGQGALGAGVRGVCALDLAYRHVAAAHRQGLVDQRHRPGAGRPRVLHVRLGQPRRGTLPRRRQFDVTRDTSKSIAFGAGPHYCAGAWASRAMVADVALPSVFARLEALRLDDTDPVRIGGWAFRGLLNLPAAWG